MSLRHSQGGARRRGLAQRCALFWILALSAVVGTSVSAQHGIRTSGVKNDGIPASLTRPNIILIITDDQRWDTVRTTDTVMPLLANGLRRESVFFRNAVVSSPLCCPVRSSILTGGFAVRHHGVLNNQLPNGGATKLADARSLGTLLQDRDYLTLYIGKYMNRYRFISGLAADGSTVPSMHYIPPGWDAFMPYIDDGFDWLGYRLGIGTSNQAGPTRGLLLPEEISIRAGALAEMIGRGLPRGLADFFLALDFGNQDHVNDYERMLALRAIDAAAGQPEKPFFLFLSLAAPHVPALPQLEDQGVFSDFFYDERGWGEEDLSDKPRHIQQNAEKFWPQVTGDSPFIDNDPRLPHEFFADQWRSLQGIDRTVDAVFERIKGDSELTSRTVIFYMSDHGLQWGEHKLLGKKKLPYEESIRIPLLVRIPGIGPRVSNRLVAGDLDVSATVLHLAGYSPEFLSRELRTDGRSLLPLAGNGADQDTSLVLIEDYRRNSRTGFPSWQAVRGRQWKYILHDTGEEELYFLPEDPYELESLHASRNPRDLAARTRLAAHLERHRGLVFLSTGWTAGVIPDGRAGLQYSFRLTAAGGTPPYTWFEAPPSVMVRQRRDCVPRLPAGITLDSDGWIQGVPTETGCFAIPAGVRDSSVSPQHGGPQQFIREVRLTIQ